MHRTVIKESNVERLLGIGPSRPGEDTTATESYPNEATAMILIHARPDTPLVLLVTR
jgi:hypothetical protein